MRILVVAPHALEVPCGNTTAIKRLVESSRSSAAELQFTVTPWDRLSGGDIPSDVDLVHAFHARRTAPFALELARERGLPLVVTVTGTDVSQDAKDPVGGPLVRASLAGADGVIALRASQLAELEATNIALPANRVVIPQGIAVGNAPYDLRGSLGLAPDAFVALLAGGLRRVKAQHLAFASLAAATAAGAAPEVVFLGPTFDPEYAASLFALGRTEPRVHFAGAVEAKHMRACYEAVDLLWNTSDAEGESNAILEAQSVCCPVIARRNTGNAALIDHGRDGWLFDTPQELAAWTQHVRDDQDSARRVARAAHDRVAPRADPRREARRHLEFYRTILAGGTLGPHAG